jgi:hypothetical protein
MKEYDLDIGWLVFMFSVGLIAGLVLAYGVVVWTEREGCACGSEMVCVPALSVERLNECIDVYVVRGNELVDARVCEGGLYSGE